MNWMLSCGNNYKRSNKRKRKQRPNHGSVYYNHHFLLLLLLFSFSAALTHTRRRLLCVCIVHALLCSCCWKYFFWLFFYFIRFYLIFAFVFYVWTPINSLTEKTARQIAKMWSLHLKQQLNCTLEIIWLLALGSTFLCVLAGNLQPSEIDLQSITSRWCCARARYVFSCIRSFLIFFGFCFFGLNFWFYLTVIETSMFVALEAALSFTIIIKIYLPHFWIVAALRDRKIFPLRLFSVWGFCLLLHARIRISFEKTFKIARDILVFI